MLGLPLLTFFMVFIFWPMMVVAAGIWGKYAFRKEND